MLGKLKPFQKTPMGLDQRKHLGKTLEVKEELIRIETNMGRIQGEEEFETIVLDALLYRTIV